MRYSVVKILNKPFDIDLEKLQRSLPPMQKSSKIVILAETPAEGLSEDSIVLR